MSWALTWHPAALHGFYELHPWTAAQLDAAILAFAETGRGPVQRVSSQDPRRLVLLVAGAGAFLYLDVDARSVMVGHVFRRR
ncbi:MAG: hypothetical protein U0441_02130 [Polyangiaceae bacterium]